jgi:hypothetical protein
MKSRAYTAGAIGVDQQDGRTAELHFDDGRVVQISALPDNRGILLRTWGVNGTVEYGGDNMTTLSAVIRLSDVAMIESMYLTGPRP